LLEFKSRGSEKMLTVDSYIGLAGCAIAVLAIIVDIILSNKK
jgi:hypothetical protein